MSQEVSLYILVSPANTTEFFVFLLQCASHRNLGWKISVMDTIDVDTTDVDPTDVDTIDVGSGDKFNVDTTDVDPTDVDTIDVGSGDKFNINIMGSGVGVQGSIFSLLLALALLCLLTY